MNIRELLITHTTASFELVNSSCYYAEHPYDVTLNGKLVYQNKQENVFSLFGLQQNQAYELIVSPSDLAKATDSNVVTHTFTTKAEYVRLNVCNFGAVGDGETLTTAALQAAILACPKGGTVVVPKGTFLTGPLFLKNHITIELQEGARLLGSTNRANYPILPGLTETEDEQNEYLLGSWEGNPLNGFASLITGIEVENVSIVGAGVIDGNASQGDWWQNPREMRGAWRPRTIFLQRCKNITLQGVRVENSPSWTIHPLYTENLRCIDIHIHNPDDSPNTDGIDPESCKNVEIIGANISVGDDCIVLKSGKLYMAMHHLQPCENIVVRNCLMERGHGAFVLGSEIAGGVKQVRVSQCLFDSTDRGLRIKTRRGRGKDSIIDGVHFDGLVMKNVRAPFTLNMFYRCDPDGDAKYVWNKEKLLVDDMTPYLGSFSFTNITCTGVHWSAGYFAGLPEQKIQKIHMENIAFSYAPKPTEGAPIMVTYPILEGHDRAKTLGIVAYNVEELVCKDVQFDTLKKDEFYRYAQADSLTIEE